MGRVRLAAAVTFLIALPMTGWCAIGKTDPSLFLPSASVPINPSLPTTKATHRQDEPVVVSADEMGYDQKNQIMIARGAVEILQGNYILRADQVTYFQKRDLVLAEGNVSLLQPTGDVMFADRAELRDALKRGVVDMFKARLSDNSVLVAREGIKVSPAVTKLVDAKYTPCHICEDASPFWQLDAGTVRMDELNEKIVYRNTTLDMVGVPVLYTPYLSTPTPDAQAHSGFFPPEYGSNNNLGTVVRVPYYWRIGDDKDMVITPSYSSEEGPLVIEDYHQLTDHGEYRIQGSATDPEKLDSNGNKIGGNQFRGHIFANGTESLTDISRVGFDIERASDDTYLRRYGFGDQPALFSRIFGESVEGRNYGLIQGLAIQGLRATDDPRTTPLVLPMFQGYYETTPDEHGIRYHVSADAQSLTRDIGIDQQRVSMTVGASRPYITDGGHVFTATVNLRQDAYGTQNLPVNGGAQLENTDTYRTIPQAALEWQYPLISQVGNDAVTIEPIVLAVAQPTGANPATISNEDSTLLELTDTNLFSIDRMPGLDLVDSGPRVAYGARGQYLFTDGTSIDALLGQNYNATDTPFPNSTTPDEKFSDYIGRTALTIAPITFAYRFALDKNDLNPNRNEVSVTFSKPWLTVVTAYRSVTNNEFLGSSKEGELDVALPITDNWSIYGGARRNLDLDEMESASSGIVFKNECFNITLDGERTYSRDRDVAPMTAVYVRVALKNLGAFGGR
jgi:LPS-assembly protein